MTARGVSPAGTAWDRLAQAVAKVLPPSEVDAVWTFAPLRRDTREWGTAVLSRIDGNRRRLYTARYVLAIKGQERGKFESFVHEVGSGPVEALARVLQEAQARMDEEQPPVPVAPESWFSSIVSPGSLGDGSPG
jgi:hypothetical protein